MMPNECFAGADPSKNVIAQLLSLCCHPKLARDLLMLAVIQNEVKDLKKVALQGRSLTSSG
jgi:hypothetical protein